MISIDAEVLRRMTWRSCATLIVLLVVLVLQIATFSLFCYGVYKINWHMLQNTMEEFNNMSGLFEEIKAALKWWPGRV